MALHGATSTSDWEEIQDAALHDLEQAAAFGALELGGYANFPPDSPPPQQQAALDPPAGSPESAEKEEATAPRLNPVGDPTKQDEFLPAEFPSGGGLNTELVGKAGGGSVHTGMIRCRCATCGKTFARQSLLNRHLKLHAGIRPFLCNVRYRTVGTYRIFLMIFFGNNLLVLLFSLFPSVLPTNIT